VTLRAFWDELVSIAEDLGHRLARTTRREGKQATAKRPFLRFQARADSRRARPVAREAVVTLCHENVHGSPRASSSPRWAHHAMTSSLSDSAPSIDSPGAMRRSQTTSARFGTRLGAVPPYTIAGVKGARPVSGCSRTAQRAITVSAAREMNADSATTAFLPR
jgi:hypothetical protein